MNDLDAIAAVARTAAHQPGRTVTVRTTTRTLTYRRAGTGWGYEVDYVDGRPRVTHNPGQLSAEGLGRLVADLQAAPLVDGGQS